MVLISVFICGCGSDNSSMSDVLTAEEKEQIEAEIRQTVEDYVEAVKAKDLEGMLSFWSDSDDFLLAGDGSIFGGYEKWSGWLIKRNKNDVVDEWLYWHNTDIHVNVLARNAAAYTMNFEDAFIEGGETRTVKGCWTYVFRKSELGWQVVVSNGTHTGIKWDE